MRKSQLALLFFGSTSSLIALLMVILRPATGQEMFIIALGMLLVLVAPIFIVRKGEAKFKALIAEHAEQKKRSEDEFAALQAKYAKLTTLDDLTGVANAQHFMEMLGQHRALSDRGDYHFTLVLIQIDQLSEIIEQEGPGRAKEVLKLCALILKKTLREVDVLGRLEADKFGLVLSSCKENDALNIIDRINELVSEIRVNEQDDVTITSSYGLATSRELLLSSEQMVTKAEQALSKAVEQEGDQLIIQKHLGAGER